MGREFRNKPWDKSPFIFDSTLNGRFFSSRLLCPIGPSFRLRVYSLQTFLLPLTKSFRKSSKRSLTVYYGPWRFHDSRKITNRVKESVLGYSIHYKNERRSLLSRFQMSPINWTAFGASTCPPFLVRPGGLDSDRERQHEYELGFRK